MLVFQKSVSLVSKKPKSPFLPRDYCGAFLSLILIHRKALETRFVVTGLAQWGWTRTGAGVGSGGYRVRFRARPRVIRYRICVGFWNMFGYMWDIVRTISGHAWGTFCGHLLDMFGTLLGHVSDIFRTCFGLLCHKNIYIYSCDTRI